MPEALPKVSVAAGSSQSPREGAPKWSEPCKTQHDDHHDRHHASDAAAEAPFDRADYRRRGTLSRERRRRLRDGAPRKRDAGQRNSGAHSAGACASAAAHRALRGRRSAACYGVGASPQRTRRQRGHGTSSRCGRAAEWRRDDQRRGGSGRDRRGGSARCRRGRTPSRSTVGRCHRHGCGSALRSGRLGRGNGSGRSTSGRGAVRQ
jgi:hypothetical protein